MITAVIMRVETSQPLRRPKEASGGQLTVRLGAATAEPRYSTSRLPTDLRTTLAPGKLPSDLASKDHAKIMLHGTAYSDRNCTPTGKAVAMPRIP